MNNIEEIALILVEKPISSIMKAAFLAAICAGMTSCIGVNQIAPPPLGFHAEDTPTPSGKRIPN